MVADNDINSSMLLNVEKQAFVSDSFQALSLAGQRITGKTFEDCVFSQCDFSNTTFYQCNFIDCRFVESNLSLVDVAYSQFSGVQFEHTKLIGIDWTKSSWEGFSLNTPVAFDHCIINDSSFFGLSLAKVEIKRCEVHDVDFREADFNAASFQSSDLLNSLFNNTNLVKADFTDATNYQIDVYLNRIQGARFSVYEALSLLASLDIELVK